MRTQCEICWNKNNIVKKFGRLLCQECINAIEEKYQRKTGKNLKAHYPGCVGKRKGKITRFINVKNAKNKFYSKLNFSKTEKLALKLYREAFQLAIASQVTYLE